MFRVTIEFEFCYGHRLLHYSGKCNRLHGHNARVQVDVESDRLDSQGMVIDFTTIKHQLKNWVDLNWDHMLILEHGDPIIGKLYGEALCELRVPPTAENLADILLVRAQSIDRRVCAVRFWETSTSYVEAHI